MFCSSRTRVVVESHHLGQLGLPGVVVEHGDVGARGHQVLDGLAVDVLPEREGRVLDEAEQARVHERLGDVLGQQLLVADQGAELAHPRDLLVAEVPDEGQSAPWPEYSCNLGQCPLEVEPVEGLGRDDDVDRSVGDRQLLRRGLRRTRVGELAPQDLEHLLDWFGGVDVMAEGDQLRGELAGAGPHLEDRRGILTDQPLHRLARERRAAAVVRLGHRAERTRESLVLFIHWLQASPTVRWTTHPVRRRTPMRMVTDSLSSLPP